MYAHPDRRRALDLELEMLIDVAEVHIHVGIDGMRVALAIGLEKAGGHRIVAASIAGERRAQRDAKAADLHGRAEVRVERSIEGLAGEWEAEEEVAGDIVGARDRKIHERAAIGVGETHTESDHVQLRCDHRRIQRAEEIEREPAILRADERTFAEPEADV